VTLATDRERRVAKGWLDALVTSVFERCGMDAADAALLADSLVTADLGGVHPRALLGGYRLWNGCARGPSVAAERGSVVSRLAKADERQFFPGLRASRSASGIRIGRVSNLEARATRPDPWP
jgi:hypothetical protein